MTTAVRPARDRRRRRVHARGLASLLLALAVLAPVALVLLALEPEPRVAEAGPPDPATVARARDVVDSLRLLAENEGAQGSWSVDEAGMNALLASARRVAPWLLGEVRVADGGAALELAAGAPFLPEGVWANLRLVLAPSEDGVRLAAARVGRLPLPPALVEHGLRLAGDRVLGDGLASAALGGVAAVRIDPPAVTVAFDEAGRAALFERLSARARSATGTDDVAEIYRHLWHLRRDGQAGLLPREGSTLPYLRHSVATSLERSRGGPAPDRLTGALLALMVYCGDKDFGPVVGVTLPDAMQAGVNDCQRTTLGGRRDLRQHFVVSAAIQAASTDKAAFGIGELKELLDSNPGGSGFGFDDLAADLAGARFAAAFLAAPPADWPAMLAAVGSEDDLLPSLDGLPTGLGDAEFRARYGDVDSPAYRAVVAEIEARIAALPLHAGAPAPESAAVR